ncbi:Asp-tRNA(Asn)/Glu-tRNA(Gln) amidotransferase subunit GatC [Lysinibacter cavernae]|uniref:Aspartyl/glutamyl-tRNA(Asn/Gln) amidotransferase subunit C n=1 Tax=Lysinibacter cavernae TaxID=1640652 RepID=A0A7X5TRP2_9MICO|nr:Asp-tRNA(Asn)/Glu-tRNA(Gln) amidotransferase subunit GatC [Lysinibacter cavernae]NIH52446.1 aspartyl-tRNA(Asn)/glutamyl-tRNA(Gln) amidotransferase subunit C [Lysinibacter cavernae]
MPENTSSPETAAEITPAVVRHLSELAKIQLDEHEIERLTADLSQIVSNIAKVSEVATPDVPATSHPIPLSNVFRPDVVGDNVLTAEQALSGAPEHHDNLFVVSAILGEEQ